MAVVSLGNRSVREPRTAMNIPVYWKLAGVLGKRNRYLDQNDEMSCRGNQKKANNPTMINKIEAARLRRVLNRLILANQIHSRHVTNPPRIAPTDAVTALS